MTHVKSRRVQWVFFDIGDVLVNEDRLRFRIFQKLEKRLKELGLQLSFEEILAAREDLILDHGDEHPYYTIARSYMSKTAYHHWHEEVRLYTHRHVTREYILIPGMKSLVPRLHRQYHLGLLADQPHQTLDFFKKEKLLRHFEVHAISGVLSRSRPRKKIFEWAINQAGCSFDQAVMIGDRIDNDIVPAKQLDMLTIQARWPTYRKGYLPQTKKETLYLASMNRIKNWRTEPAGEQEAPDATVERVAELPRKIERFG